MKEADWFRFKVEEMNKVAVEGPEGQNKEAADKWADLKALCERDGGEQLVAGAEAALQELVQKAVAGQGERDAQEQFLMFGRWETEQTAEVEEQARRFALELSKASIVRRVEELERQEELLTYFERRQQISNAYHNQGFGDEDPALIPVQPDETTFRNKFDRHFKPYQKYANRPPPDVAAERNRQDVLDSLRKIYLDNRQAQTNYDPKMSAKK